MTEQGVPNFQIAGWNALYAPKGTPPEALRLLATELTKVMAQPETRERFLALGIDPQIVTGAELTAFLRAERDKWGKLIRAMGIKAE